MSISMELTQWSITRNICIAMELNVLNNGIYYPEYYTMYYYFYGAK